MKRNLLQIGLAILLSSSLFGFTYEIKDGWQQVGAIQDIDDLSIFNNAGCVDHVWYYDNTNTADPQWKLHIANGNTYNYCGETLTSLKKGQGFWVKATGECTITIDESNSTTSNIPTPPNLESGTCDMGTPADIFYNDPNAGTYIVDSNTGVRLDNGQVWSEVRYPINENISLGSFIYSSYSCINGDAKSTKGYTISNFQGGTIPARDGEADAPTSFTTSTSCVNFIKEWHD